MIDHADADTVLVNGTVVTVEETSSASFEHRSDPFPSAVAIRGTKVLGVGSDDEIAALVGRSTRTIDLAGRTVIPGIIDSHLHFIRAGQRWLHDIRWENCDSLDSALDAVARPPQNSGGWAVVLGGWHWHQFREGRPPNRADLDSVAPHHPVFVQFMYAWALINQVAIGQIKGPLRSAPDNVRQGFSTDRDGNLTGMVRGIPAFQWILAQVPTRPFESEVRGTIGFAQELNRLGVTGLIDAGGFGTGPGASAAAIEAWRRGDLTLRVRLLVQAARPGAEREDLEGYCRYATARFGDDILQVLGAGEAIQYSLHDRIGREGDVSPEALRAAADLFRGLAASRWPMHIHAHNRRLLDELLDSWVSLARTTPIQELRWALVHAERLDPERIDRLVLLGAGVLLQALYRFGGDDALEAWGQSVPESPPVRHLLDNSIHIGLGTDATVVADYNPFRNLSWFLTGETLSGRDTLSRRNLLSRREALFGYTNGSAWFSFEERDRGRLVPGARADLAVLNDDYFAVSDREVANLRSDLTMLNGAVVWQAD